jgi:hypothetical protein
MFSQANLLGNLSLKRISTASTLMIDESVGDL